MAFDSVTAFDFDSFEFKVTQRPDNKHIEKETAWINVEINYLLLEMYVSKNFG